MSETDRKEAFSELAEAQARLDNAFQQLRLNLPEREVRALGQRVNDLLSAFARQTSAENKRLRNALMDCRDAALMTATTGHQTPEGALQDVYYTAKLALGDDSPTRDKATATTP